MTQPPLSQSIIALEKEIGAPLFARTKRSVTLTSLGAQWLPHVQAVLCDVDALPDIAQQLRDGRSGRLDLSFVSTADYSILPNLVQHYAARFPRVDIHLTEATSDVQISRLLAGEGQAGLIIPPSDTALPASLQYRPLMREPLIAAIPEIWLSQHLITTDEAGSISPEAIANQPLLLFPRQAAPAFHDIITGYYANHGYRPHIAQEAIQMQTIISLVSAGMGLSLVPASLRAMARAGVRYINLGKDAPVLETGLVWRKEDNSPTLRQFLDVAANSAGG